MDVRGIDSTWFALDADGHVGVFTTGGEGPVPPWLDPAWADAVFDELVTLAARGAHRLVTKDRSPSRYADPFQTWKRWADRGFYAYDWSDVHRAPAARLHRYELIASPTRPIGVEPIPEALRRQPRPSRGCFATMPRVEIGDATSGGAGR